MQTLKLASPGPTRGQETDYMRISSARETKDETNGSKLSKIARGLDLSSSSGFEPQDYRITCFGRYP